MMAEYETCLYINIDLFHIQPSLKGAWIFELYVKCKLFTDQHIVISKDALIFWNELLYHVITVCFISFIIV